MGFYSFLQKKYLPYKMYCRSINDKVETHFNKVTPVSFRDFNEHELSSAEQIIPMENSDLPLAEVTSISRSVQCATGITYANPESEIVSIDYLQTCLFESQFLNWIQLKDVKLFLKSSYFDKNYEFDGVIETVSINMQRKIISLELFRDRLDMASNVQPFSFNVHDIISLQIFY